jgi:hypothetical protein
VPLDPIAAEFRLRHPPSVDSRLGGPVDTGPRRIGVNAKTDPDDLPAFALAAISLG